MGFKSTSNVSIVSVKMSFDINRSGECICKCEHLLGGQPINYFSCGYGFRNFGGTVETTVLSLCMKTRILLDVVI